MNMDVVSADDMSQSTEAAELHEAIRALREENSVLHVRESVLREEKSVLQCMLTIERDMNEELRRDLREAQVHTQRTSSAPSGEFAQRDRSVVFFDTALAKTA